LLTIILSYSRRSSSAKDPVRLKGHVEVRTPQ